MRPILVQTGPWTWWAYPIVVAALTLIVALFLWLESRSRDPQRLTVSNCLILGAFVLGSAALVVLGVNHVAPVYVHSYGVMLLLGLAAGVWWLNYSGRRFGFTGEQWIDFALVVLLCGVAGARLLYVVLHWPEYAPVPITMLYLWKGGLAFHGGVGGALLGAYIFARVRRLEFPLLLDVSAPALALGYAFTRVGCFLNGCCYGTACTLPWAVIFPPDTEAGAGGMARHPVQLYAVAANVVIFGVLAKLAPRVKVRGNLFLGYLVLYSIYRFLVELVRRGASAKVFAPLAPLTEAQSASIIIGVGALVWLLLRRRAAQAKQR